MAYGEPLEIHGKVRQENNISIVSIEMKMGLIRKAAFCISASIILLVMMVLFIVSLKEPPALIASTIGLVLSPFTIIMMHYYFRADVQATKPILLRILGETKTIDFSQPK